MYPVNEVFETIQGEGKNSGLAAIFVRLQGCEVGCSWCDTKHTWTLDPALQVSPEQVLCVDGEVGRWSHYSSEQLIDAFKAQGFQAKLVVITGGEPCQYDLTELCQALEAKGYQVQIETSGTELVKVSDGAWVTVSPKINMKGGKAVLVQALERANEIKHPIARQRHIDELDALLEGIDLTNKSMCLQPISQIEAATALAMKTCIERNWRLSVQMHKYLQID
ncbi:7-carboxy-7-deazaguanine synthase QueE [Paraferrimonas haliotis]|uniref:7-carboxy-7-deazaguanine synthase n=1 Tax=Paraferrimonas haliotis TaxID=2013866 RepID=A0AA37TUH6_9GAMM|nr:7-carboxy-7-deazaguanine synthase QueE [Paraferrimonas haliotis]GLS84436.1 7-carboxy-7-deazaguanine synthase [Paraferrimonas haliotis]